jgi:molybdate transport system substrate-binding protein
LASRGPGSGTVQRFHLWWLRLLLLALLTVVDESAFVLPSPASEKSLLVAAASDLHYAFKEMIADFERNTGQPVKLSLGSSGNFFAQIQNGAPFDVYFSADIGFPRKLVDTGYALPESLYQYATGRIVLWTPKTSGLAVQERGMDVLSDPSIKKIAIANPKHAPYGRAAVAAMQHAKLYERVKDKIVLGENVSQAAQFVESGAVDIGIIALSLAKAPTLQAAGSYWLIPANTHQPIDQGAVIIKASPNREAAKAFLDFLRTPAARRVMRQYGFVLPGDEGRQPEGR